MVVPYRSHSTSSGSGKPQDISDAQKDAETLFESQTVVEIREVSTAPVTVPSCCCVHSLCKEQFFLMHCCVIMTGGDQNKGRHRRKEETAAAACGQFIQVEQRCNAIS
jgi:hypothetical protein